MLDQQPLDNPLLDFEQEFILAVDDEKEILDLYATFLGSAGYKVLLALEPSKALKILEERQVFLVITDFRMPKTNGVTLCGIVKEKYPGMPVVIISAFVNEARASLEASRIGADELLSKPFDSEQLKLMVRHYANLRKKELLNRNDGYETLK